MQTTFPIERAFALARKARSRPNALANRVVNYSIHRVAKGTGLCVQGNLRFERVSGTACKIHTVTVIGKGKRLCYDARLRSYGGPLCSGTLGGDHSLVLHSCGIFLKHRFSSMRGYSSTPKFFLSSGSHTHTVSDNNGMMPITAPAVIRDQLLFDLSKSMVLYCKIFK